MMGSVGGYSFLCAFLAPRRSFSLADREPACTSAILPQNDPPLTIVGEPPPPALPRDVLTRAVAQPAHYRRRESGSSDREPLPAAKHNSFAVVSRKSAAADGLTLLVPRETACHNKPPTVFHAKAIAPYESQAQHRLISGCRLRWHSAGDAGE